MSQNPVSRIAPSTLLLEHPLIAVLRASDASQYDAVVDVLVENGVRCIELTLTTAGTLDRLAALIVRVGASAEIGVGTVTNTDEASRAIASGANYLVTPVVVPDVIAAAVGAGVAIYPGGLSPTELWTAWSAGATAVKIFPAQTVGPSYATHVRGPFPELRFVPSGGIVLDDISDWLAAGATAVSLGGPLIGDAFRGGSLDGLADRARRAVDIATVARPGCGS